MVVEICRFFEAELGIFQRMDTGLQCKDLSWSSVVKSIVKRIYSSKLFVWKPKTPSSCLAMRQRDDF